MDCSSALPQQQGAQDTPSTQDVRGYVSRPSRVCIECRRLKTKCDRKHPCTECDRRDTTTKCTYPHAGPGMIDLRTLENRLSAVEAQLASQNRSESNPSAQLDNHALSAVGCPRLSLASHSEGDHANVCPDQLYLNLHVARGIIFSLRVLHGVCKYKPSDARSKHSSPGIFGYYLFAQALFDAAVVCARSVIMHPNAIWAGVAVDDISYALELMKDPTFTPANDSFRSGAGSGVGGHVREIENLKARADWARLGNDFCSGSSPGLKRKHSEVDDPNHGEINSREKQTGPSSYVSASSFLPSETEDTSPAYSLTTYQPPLLASNHDTYAQQGYYTSTLNSSHALQCLPAFNSDSTGHLSTPFNPPPDLFSFGEVANTF